ncbi:hypothetical protein BD414DRAFT_491635 [Trametes punicea]|nr:hypothetical protein BD414DRAFT_491635 [Trametes punicea]
MYSKTISNALATLYGRNRTLIMGCLIYWTWWPTLASTICVFNVYDFAIHPQNVLRQSTGEYRQQWGVVPECFDDPLPLLLSRTMPNLSVAGVRAYRQPRKIVFVLLCIGSPQTGRLAERSGRRQGHSAHCAMCNDDQACFYREYKKTREPVSTLPVPTHSLPLWYTSPRLTFSASTQACRHARTENPPTLTRRSALSRTGSATL